MPRTPEQIAMRNATRGAQVGLSPEAYAEREGALRTGEYTRAAFDPARGNTLPEATRRHLEGGGTYRGLLGDRYEFLDRGGLGAPAGGGMQSGVTANPFLRVNQAPGLQPPALQSRMPDPGPARAPGHGASATRGFQGVTPPARPGLRRGFGG